MSAVFFFPQLGLALVNRQGVPPAYPASIPGVSPYIMDRVDFYQSEFVLGRGHLEAIKHKLISKHILYQRL